MRLAPHPHPVHLGGRPEGALRAHEPVVLRRRRRLGRPRRLRRGERISPEGIRPLGTSWGGGGAKCSGERVIGGTVELVG